MLKVSVISTVWNEGPTIGVFLDSLLTQTRTPDEIVIADGGSTDNTVAVVQGYIDRGAPIILISGQRLNVAEGRNVAISRATHEYIAATDAGCVIRPDWLEQIVVPFETDPSVNVVSGWYEATPSDIPFRMVENELLVSRLHQINPETFLPSSRSVAFTKTAWRKSGGYPEWLTLSGEDFLYNHLLKRSGAKFVFQPKAIVLWDTPPTYKRLARTFYNYGVGAGEARYFDMYYVYTTVLFFLGCLGIIAGWWWLWLWLILAIGIVLYAYIPLWMNWRVHFFTKPIRQYPPSFWWHLGLVRLTVYFSSVRGWLVGRWRHKVGDNKYVA